MNNAILERIERLLDMLVDADTTESARIRTRIKELEQLAQDSDDL